MGVVELQGKVKRLEELLFTEQMLKALPGYQKSKHHLNGCREGVVLGHEWAFWESIFLNIKVDNVFKSQVTKMT